jgi:hypothetical protein
MSVSATDVDNQISTNSSNPEKSTTQEKVAAKAKPRKTKREHPALYDKRTWHDRPAYKPRSISKSSPPVNPMSIYTGVDFEPNMRGRADASDYDSEEEFDFGMVGKRRKCRGPEIDCQWFLAGYIPEPGPGGDSWSLAPRKKGCVPGIPGMLEDLWPPREKDDVPSMPGVVGDLWLEKDEGRNSAMSEDEVEDRFEGDDVESETDTPSTAEADPISQEWQDLEECEGSQVSAKSEDRDTMQQWEHTDGSSGTPDCEDELCSEQKGRMKNLVLDALEIARKRQWDEEEKERATEMGRSKIGGSDQSS